MAVDILSEAYPMIPISCRSIWPDGTFKISSFAYAYVDMSPFCSLQYFVSNLPVFLFPSAVIDCFCLTFFVCQCSGSKTFCCGSGSGASDLWIRIRIRILLFSNKKIIVKKVYLIIIFWRYIYISFKDKKPKRSHKTVGIKVFLSIFAWW